MRYREAARKLTKLGCYEIPRRGGGSHRRWFNPGAQKDAVLPDWGSRDLKTGTLRSAIRQLDLDWVEFQEA
ncbi:MAG: type II toxin-antitoxin system HicA family toxin [Caldilineaceae bacterium SB0665_bin_25]|nr:type II toxin-antitoxin system HicA family toxin [Caldilineaceae bacterium SB0665_bin_25]